MAKFIGKRILLIIPTLLAVIFIVFSILALTPGTPGRAILGATATQEAVDQLNTQLGYDQPFLSRFVNYIAGVVQGDFGKSYNTGKMVFSEIFSRFPTTLIIALLGVTCSALIGIPLGVLSAVKQYSFIDGLSTTAALFMAAIPGFWLGLLLMLFFSLRLGWLPASGIGSWQNYVLPTITLCLPGAAEILRMTRTTMLETIRQDYVRTARAKGASESSVVWTHALHNALLPVVTSLGTSFGAMLGGTVIIESVFAMPGLGTLIINSINSKDIPVVMGSVIFLAAIFCVIMLVVDLVYGLIDPRVKAKYIK